jgi:hypothetical protein
MTNVSETRGNTETIQADGTLIFKGATDADGKDNKFEMKLTGGNSANLKFFGTPVETNPWKLNS